MSSFHCVSLNQINYMFQMTCQKKVFFSILFNMACFGDLIYASIRGKVHLTLLYILWPMMAGKRVETY